MGEPNSSNTRGRKPRKYSKSTVNARVNKKKSTSPKVVKKELLLPDNRSPQLTPPSEPDLPTESSFLSISTIATIDPSITELASNETHAFNSDPSITSIAIEIFMNICEHLPPSDLFSLVLVCRKFREILCNASPVAQKIWKTSRLKFLRYLQKPAPPGMDERGYIVLRQLEKGCQFCQDHGSGFVKVYWEFRVRCCEMCLDKRTTRRDILYIDWIIPDIVLRTLPYIYRGAAQVYWTSDVHKAMEQYNAICESCENEDEVLNWVDDQQRLANRIMEEAPSREREEHEEQISKLEESIDKSYPMVNDVQHILSRQPQIIPPMNFMPMGLANHSLVSPLVSPISNPVMNPLVSPISPISPGSPMITNPMANPTLMFANSLPQLNRGQYVVPTQFTGALPYNRSQFMIAPPVQRLYPAQFMSHINRQNCYGIGQMQQLYRY
ncbi:12906_t:CDS:2 [Acaulospora morrowiae]|uniref:12906_t:CDS:1 n=1 Tax=Acaulospora morrowiae TaxID=94023 RepID=A0A9N9A7T9_9GLOM|nr:12906_t:CDS:2 [Acaulospora morrowiae]